MSLKFACEACGAKLAIKDGAWGRRIKCPKCGAMIGAPVERIELPIVVEPEVGYGSPLPTGPNPPPTSAAPTAGIEPLEARQAPALSEAIDDTYQSSAVQDRLAALERETAALRVSLRNRTWLLVGLIAAGSLAEFSARQFWQAKTTAGVAPAVVASAEVSSSSTVVTKRIIVLDAEGNPGLVLGYRAEPLQTEPGFFGIHLCRKGSGPYDCKAMLALNVVGNPLFSIGGEDGRSSIYMNGENRSLTFTGKDGEDQLNLGVYLNKPYVGFYDDKNREHQLFDSRGKPLFPLSEEPED